MKEKHSLKKQHKLSKFGSERKIFVRGIPEIPFNYLPWNLSKSHFFVWVSLLFLSVQVFHRHKKSDYGTIDVFLVWIQSNTSSVFSYIVHLLMVRISDIPKSHSLYEWLKVKLILKMTLQLWDSRSLSIKRATEKSPLLSFSYVKLIFY